MKSSIEELSRDLYSIRSYVDQQANMISPDFYKYVDFCAARENLLETIDTVGRQMQARLGSALKVGL